MQSSEQFTPKTTEQSHSVPYEIDPNELELVLNRVVSSLGSRAIQEQLKDLRSPVDKIKNLVDSVMTPDNIVTGCKYYSESLMPDGTFNNSFKTVVITSYLHLKFLGLHKMQAKKVVLSHQMRAKLSELFDSVATDIHGSTEKSKVLMFKNVTDTVSRTNKSLPSFVQKNPGDFVFLKVILKLPNV